MVGLSAWRGRRPTPTVDLRCDEFTLGSCEVFRRRADGKDEGGAGMGGGDVDEGDSGDGSTEDFGRWERMESEDNVPARLRRRFCMEFDARGFLNGGGA